MRQDNGSNDRRNPQESEEDGSPNDGGTSSNNHQWSKVVHIVQEPKPNAEGESSRDVRESPCLCKVDAFFQKRRDLCSLKLLRVTAKFHNFFLCRLCPICSNGSRYTRMVTEFLHTGFEIYMLSFLGSYDSCIGDDAIRGQIGATKMY